MSPGSARLDDRRWYLAAVVCAALGCVAATLCQEAAPKISIHVTSRPLGYIAQQVREQARVPLYAHEDIDGRRMVTVSVSGRDLVAVLNSICLCSLSAWDYAYIVMPAEAAAQSPQWNGWQKPPSVRFDLEARETTWDEAADLLTIKSGALVGVSSDIAQQKVALPATQGAEIEQILERVAGPPVAVVRGILLVGLDRTSIFARLSAFPRAQREQMVLKLIAQLEAVKSKDIERVLRREQREFRKLPKKERIRFIKRAAENMTVGVQVLNGLSPEVRERAREALQRCFDAGLEIYQDLTEEEQIETTPMIEAMGKLKR